MFQLWKDEKLINTYEYLETAQLVQSAIGGTVVALGKNNTITGIIVGIPNYRTTPIFLKDSENPKVQLALTLGILQRSTKKGRIGYING